MTQRFARLAAAFGIAALLAACSGVGNTFDDIFGKAPEDQLPGQRIAILALDVGHLGLREDLKPSRKS